jgi:hypothetical protein
VLLSGHSHCFIGQLPFPCNYMIIVYICTCSKMIWSCKLCHRITQDILFSNQQWYSIMMETKLLRSDDLEDNKKFVYTFNRTILDMWAVYSMQSSRLGLYYFSDHPSSQLKNRFTAKNRVIVKISLTALLTCLSLNLDMARASKWQWWNC